MRIKTVELSNFKRFSHLIVKDIPQSTKLVVLVGPNGSGKTSFFDALNQWYQFEATRSYTELDYYNKSGSKLKFDGKIDISFFDFVLSGKEVKGHFYFRGAYRNEFSFNIDSLKKQSNLVESVNLKTLMENDMTVSSNYQRLISSSIRELYDPVNCEKTVSEIRERLIGKINASLSSIFSDLRLSGIGDPLENGSFYFDKGTARNFNYKNLSAGEKSTFDLILDIVIKSEYYKDAIYCIDEPESHMHTRLQGKVLNEIYNLIPGNSQLWISTHSIGMIREAYNLEMENPGTVIFLDFDGKDFDDDQIIMPIDMGKAVWDRFYDLAFGDFAKLLLPEKIVFCEGSSKGGNRKDFDKQIYEKIFNKNHPNTYFISAGSCEDISHIEGYYGDIMKSLLSKSKIIKVIDRDDRSEEEIKEFEGHNVRVLSKRHIESYLLDDSLIKKLCDIKGKSDKFNECIVMKQREVSSSVSRGNPLDDIKSASGTIYDGLKRILVLTQCGNNGPNFLRDTMTPLVTEDTEMYKLLEKEIFGK